MGYQENFKHVVLENSYVQVLRLAFTEWKLVDVIHKQKSKCCCGHVIFQDFIIINKITLKDLHVGCCCIKRFALGTEMGDEIMIMHKIIEAKQRLYDSYVKKKDDIMTQSLFSDQICKYERMFDKFIYEKEKILEETREKTNEMKRNKFKLQTLKFKTGKYQGETFINVLEIDPSYCKFVAEKCKHFLLSYAFKNLII